ASCAFCRPPAALGADESVAETVLRAAVRGGLCHVVYDGGLPAAVRQGALFEAYAGGPKRNLRVAPARGTPGRPVAGAMSGGPVPGADSAVPRPADQRAAGTCA